MKILVEVHHGLGDVVKMIPVIEELQEAYPSSKISVIVSSKEHAQILKIARQIQIDNIYYLNIRKMDYGQQIRFILDLRKEKFDIGVIASMTTRSLGWLFLKMLGVDKILLPDNSAESLEFTTVQKCLSALNKIELPTNYDRIPNIELNPETYQIADNLLESKDKEKGEKEKYVGICMGTGSFARGRGIFRKYYNAKAIDIGETLRLAREFKDRGYNVLLIGGGPEKEALKEYLPKLPQGIISFAGEVNVVESIALISRCEFLIGGDTGMIHAADAIGINTLVYYGPTGPKVGPFSDKTVALTAELDCQYCYGTKQLYKCQNRKCLEFLTSERILEAALRAFVK